MGKELGMFEDYFERDYDLDQYDREWEHKADDIEEELIRRYGKEISEY